MEVLHAAAIILIILSIFTLIYLILTEIQRIQTRKLYKNNEIWVVTREFENPFVEADTVHAIVTEIRGDYLKYEYWHVGKNYDGRHLKNTSSKLLFLKEFKRLDDNTYISRNHWSVNV